VSENLKNNKQEVKYISIQRNFSERMEVEDLKEVVVIL
jgi:hypothetical protein